MRTRLACFVGLVLLCTSSPLRAQDILVPEDNAALWYWQAMVMLGPDYGKEAAAALRDRETGADEIASIRSELEDAFELVERASTCEHCDFGTKWEDGWDALLPHLAGARGLMRVLVADATRLLDAGEDALAAHRLASTIHLAGHVASHRCVIDLLVALACTRGGDAAVTTALSKGHFDVDDRALLADAYRSALRRGVCRADWTIVGEVDTLMPWLEDLGHEGFLELIAESPLHRRATAVLNPQSYRSLLEQYVSLTRAQARAIAHDDFDALDEIDSNFSEMRYGVVAGALSAPAPTLARQTHDTHDSILATLVELGHVESPTAPENKPAAPRSHNAALAYWRAIDSESHLGGDRATEFAGILEDPDATADEIETARERTELIIDHFLDASNEPTCRFAIDRTRGMFAQLPHLSGMRACAKVLCADAPRLLTEGNEAEAVERLVATLGASRHLAHDDVAISNLVATSLFDMADAVVDQALERDELTDEAQARLALAYAPFATEDALRMRGIVEGERWANIAWFRKIGTAAKAAEALDRAFEDLPEDEMLKPLGRMGLAIRLLISEGRFDEAIANYERLLTELGCAIDIHDAAALDELEASVESLEYGALAEVSAPFKALHELMRAYGDARERLEALRGGE